MSMVKPMLVDTLNVLTRCSLGFDALFDDLTSLSNNPPSYPPYNLIRDGNEGFRIEVAVAGFAPEELHVEIQNGTLRIYNTEPEWDLGEDASSYDIKQIKMLAGIDLKGDDYIHRGIARRTFSLQFRVNETIEIDSASLKNGLLTVRLLNKAIEKNATKIKISVD